MRLPWKKKRQAPETFEGDRTSEQQAVLVDLRLSCDFGSDAERQRVYELEDKLIAALDASGAGEVDGTEFGGGGVTLFAYGPDADALYAAMHDLILEFGPTQGSSATLRYGGADDADAKERIVPLA